MKKKNTLNSSFEKIQTASAINYFMRANKAIARMYNTSKRYLKAGKEYLVEGNIFGENEEDFYSHAVNA